MAAESYLNGQAILEAARTTGADAIHPGYGFLSENTSFAAACGEVDIIFIGPPASAVKIMGDKALAKRAMLLAALLAVTASCQRSLDARGNCVEFLRSAGPAYEDPIRDRAFELTTGLNAVMFGRPALAGGLQAVCSLSLDASMVGLLVCGGFLRSSSRPFLAMFFLMMTRFAAQRLDQMPCPPGYMWPHGALLGWRVPSLFVDYHTSNDFFFSGHAGTVVVGAGVIKASKRPHVRPVESTSTLRISP